MVIKMLNSAMRMEALFELYAEKEELDEELMAEIRRGQNRLRDDVDECIEDLEYIKSQIKHAETMTHAWGDRKSRLEVILDRKKEEILKDVKLAEFEGIELKGKHGVFKTVKNSVPTLVVDEENHDLKQRYMRSKWSESFDRAQLKKELLAGIEVEGAKLIYGEHLRY